MTMRHLLGSTSSLTTTIAAAALLYVPCGAAQAQQLYMPRAVKQAYDKGTRSPDGRPGP
jgi:hypothetical protein